MRNVIVRKIAATSLLVGGLAAWSGCTTEAPVDGPAPPSTGTPTNPPKAGDALDRVERAAARVGDKIESGSVQAVDGAGKLIGKAGEKLDGPVKDAAQDHIGTKAAGVAEKAGQGLEKAGEKIRGAVHKPE
jgi:hypothetical protein